MIKLDILKNFTVNSASIEEAIFAAENMQALAAGYEKRKLEIPEWIANKLDEVEAYINVQVMAERKASLKKLKMRRSTLATAEEKRIDLDKQISELEGMGVN